MKTDHIPLSRSLFKRLAAQDLDVLAILQRAGLPPDLVTQSRVVLTTTQFFALWQAIEMAGDDPALGLRIGAATRSETRDVVSLAALHSASLGEALYKLARYKRLTCPEDISIEVGNGEAAISFHWMLADSHTPTLLIDAIFASTLALAQRGTGESLLPRRVELIRRPRHASVLAHHFGCEVRFNAGQDRLVFDQDDLTRPFLIHSEDRLAALMPALESALREQNASLTLHDQVRHVLARRMHGKPQRMAQIADALHLSSRTMQRRLGATGTSYQDVLSQVRRDTARHLLDATDLDTGEIAFLLGFEELNSFTRAFRQWEGQTPQRWRQATDT